MGELAVKAGQNGCPSVGILPGLLLVAAEHIAPPLQRRLRDGELGLALLAWNDERHRHPVILDHLVADLLGGPLAHAENVREAGLLQRRNGGGADHAAVGDDAHLGDAKTLAQPLDDRHEPRHIGGVAGPQEGGERPVVAVENHAEHHLLEVRTIVFAVAELAQRLSAGTLEVQRCRIEEGDRHFAKQLLPMAVEVLFDGIRSGAAVGDLLAEPNHRAVGVIERQLFSAGNAEAMVPSAGMAIRARDHQAMQYREIDRSLDVEAEPSPDKQGTDHLGAAGLPPQPTEHKIRADADPPQLGKLAAIEARQNDRAKPT